MERQFRLSTYLALAAVKHIIFMIKNAPSGAFFADVPTLFDAGSRRLGPELVGQQPLSALDELA